MRTNTSEVRLLLNKKNKKFYNIAKDVNGTKVYPDVKKFFQSNDQQIKDKFFQILAEEINMNSIDLVIGSKKIFNELKTKKNITSDFIDLDNDNNIIASLDFEIEVDKIRNKNVLILISDFTIRENVKYILKEHSIKFLDVIEIIGDHGVNFNEKYFFPLEKNIYPINIPKIKVKKDIDVLLIDSPSRNLSLMPNGLGYVYNALKKEKLKFDILDLDIITYHRFHSKRIYDERGIIEFEGKEIPEDPWRAENYDFWTEKGEFNNFDENLNIKEIFKHLPILRFIEPVIDETFNEIKRVNPKIIGFSIQSCNTPFAKILAKKIKQFNKEIIIVVGGFSCYNADIGLKAFPDADYMCIGEADLTIGPLIKSLIGGDRPFNLAGVLSKFDKTDYHKNFVQAPMIHDLDRIEAPKYEWTDLDIYRNYNDYQLVPIIASRGCRWSRCTFCAERFYWRIRSAKNFVDELEWLVSEGTHLYMFNESDLNGMPERVLEICDEIISRGLHEKVILTGQLRIHKKSTKEFFQKLYKAGFRALRFGVDAFSKNTLKLQQKGYTVDMIDQNLKDCHESGISTEVNWVIGVPGETDDDVNEGIELILRNRKYIDRLANINPLILANGSVYWIDPEAHDIKFNQSKETLFKKYPRALPANTWYSENPYIDANTRKKRFEHIVYSLYKNVFPLGDWANKIVEQVLSGEDKSRSSETETDYNYNPSFEESNKSNPILVEIYKNYKLYLYNKEYFAVPISKEIENNNFKEIFNQKSINKDFDIETLKKQILEINKFADSRGQYEYDEKKNKDIYKVDSFSEEQNFKKNSLKINNSKFFFFKKDKELFIADLEDDSLNINELRIEKIIKIHEIPELISSFNGLNVVRYNFFYYALPIGLRINWMEEEDLKDVHVVRSKNLNDLFDQIGNQKTKDKLITIIRVKLITLNNIIWRASKMIATQGLIYFIKKASSKIVQHVKFQSRRLNNSILNTLNKIIRKKFIFKLVKNNKNDLQKNKAENVIPTNQFIKKIDNYKIYKMEGMYYGFPNKEKVNFDEVDYMMNDNVIKDFSIDAVETKIIELR